jgi:hypothetical protein
MKKEFTVTRCGISPPLRPRSRRGLPITKLPPSTSTKLSSAEKRYVEEIKINNENKKTERKLICILYLNSRVLLEFHYITD